MSIKLTFSAQSLLLPAALDDRHAPSLCQLSPWFHPDSPPTRPVGELFSSTSQTRRKTDDAGANSSLHISCRCNPASHIATGAVHPVHIVPPTVFELSRRQGATLRGPADLGHGSVARWRRADDPASRRRHMGGCSDAVQNYTAPGGDKTRKAETTISCAPRRRNASLYSSQSIENDRTPTTELMRASDVLADKINYSNRLPASATVTDLSRRCMSVVNRCKLVDITDVSLFRCQQIQSG